MIPTEPEQDNLRAARGIINGLAISVLIIVLVAVTIWHLHRTPAGAVQAAAQTEVRP